MKNLQPTSARIDTKKNKEDSVVAAGLGPNSPQASRNEQPANGGMTNRMCHSSQPDQEIPRLSWTLDL